MGELWDLYDRDRKPLNKTYERGSKEWLKKNEYHIVVHIWIVNDKGEILLTKRDPRKPKGNLWEATGGSVIAGETSLQGAIRETVEEIGLEFKEEDFKLIKTEVREHFNDIFDAFIVRANPKIEDLKYQEGEVVDSKWVTKKEYNEMFEKGEIVDTLGYFITLYNKALGLPEDKQLRPRASAIIKYNDGIILVHRVREDEGRKREYYVIPGGGVEEGESIEEATIREVKEEIGIDIKLTDKYYKYYIMNRWQYFYIAEYVSGKVGTGDGPEFTSPDYAKYGSYKIEVVPFEKIKNINLQPVEIKEIIIKEVI